MGGIVRFLLSTFVQQQFNSTFPWATLAVNLVGCFLIGVSLAVVSHYVSLSAYFNALIITGFLGGMTTFSSFSMETVTMLMQGAWRMAFAYVSLSCVAGILLSYAGLALMQWCLSR